MTPLLLATFLWLACLPAAAASAAAASCPRDDEFGPGDVFGIGPQHVLAGVPDRPAGHYKLGEMG